MSRSCWAQGKQQSVQKKVFWIPETSSLVWEIKQKDTKRQPIREDRLVQGMFLAGEQTKRVAAMFGGWGALERVGMAGT